MWEFLRVCCLAIVYVLLHSEVVSSHVRYVFICHVIWETESCFLCQCLLTLVYCSTCVILDCWNVIRVTFSCTWRIVFVCAAHWFKYCIWRPTDLLYVRVEGAGCSCSGFPLILGAAEFNVHSADFCTQQQEECDITYNTCCSRSYWFSTSLPLTIYAFPCYVCWTWLERHNTRVHGTFGDGDSSQP
jgi:hypothetical protein